MDNIRREKKRVRIVITVCLLLFYFTTSIGASALTDGKSFEYNTATSTAGVTKSTYEFKVPYDMTTPVVIVNITDADESTGDIDIDAIKNSIKINGSTLSLVDIIPMTATEKQKSFVIMLPSLKKDDVVAFDYSQNFIDMAKEYGYNMESTMTWRGSPEAQTQIEINTTTHFKQRARSATNNDNSGTIGGNTGGTNSGSSNASDGTDIGNTGSNSRGADTGSDNNAPSTEVPFNDGTSGAADSTDDFANDDSENEGFEDDDAFADEDEDSDADDEEESKALNKSGTGDGDDSASDSKSDDKAGKETVKDDSSKVEKRSDAQTGDYELLIAIFMLAASVIGLVINRKVRQY